MAAQWYLQRKNSPLVKWVETHPERREGHPPHYSYQDCGIFIADCYASAKAPPQDIPYSTYDIPAATLIRNSIPSECWYLSTPDGTPTMTNPIKRMQDQQLHRYWNNRSSQSNHHIQYQGASTYMLHRAGHLSKQNLRNQARKVKHILDWRVHGRKLHLMTKQPQDSQCPICIQPDSMFHILFECSHSISQDCRQK